MELHQRSVASFSGGAEGESIHTVTRPDGPTCHPLLLDSDPWSATFNATTEVRLTASDTGHTALKSAGPMSGSLVLRSGVGWTVDRVPSMEASRLR